MKALHVISWILLVIGGLNWGVVGLTGTDYLAMYLPSSVTMIVYILVGLSAIVSLFTHKKDCKNCETSSSAM